MRPSTLPRGRTFDFALARPTGVPRFPRFAGDWTVLLILQAILLLILALASTAPAAPDAPASEPAGQPAPLVDGEKLKIVVTAIEGAPDYRLPGEDKFKPAVVGFRCEEGVEFRTGIRQRLQFLIEPQEVVRVDRCTSVIVARAEIEKGVLKSNVVMKYGKVSAFVDVAGRPHESLVMTPSGVMSATDTTRFATEAVGFPPKFGALEGSVVADFRNGAKQKIGERGKKNNVTLKEGKATAAETALEARTVDPSIAFARSNGEDRLVQYVLNSGATVGFDRQLNLPTVRGGTVPQADTELVPILPGVLNFVLRWQGNSDLNLGLNVGATTGGNSEFIYPIAGLNRSPSGGRIPFDHRGGPNGGYEVIYWPRNTYQEGNYAPFVVNQKGPAATARLDVFQNGQRVPITSVDGSTGNMTLTDTVTAIIPPRSSGDEQASLGLNVPITRTGVNVTTPAASRRSR